MIHGVSSSVALDDELGNADLIEGWVIDIQADVRQGAKLAARLQALPLPLGNRPLHGPHPAGPERGHDRQQRTDVPARRQMDDGNRLTHAGIVDGHEPGAGPPRF